jgi:hypothetical protein
VQAPRGAGERQLLGDRDEVLEMAEFHQPSIIAIGDSGKHEMSLAEIARAG